MPVPRSLPGVDMYREVVGMPRQWVCLGADIPERSGIPKGVMVGMYTPGTDT